MLDDIRAHGAAPTLEESQWIAAGEWIASGPVVLVVRAVALAGLAMGLGVAVSLLLEPAYAAAAVATVGL